jgi:ubiquinone biosynthesis protein Coq4
MPRTIPDTLAEPVARILKGAIDTGDGGTDEQRGVLRAVAVGFLGRADLDVDALEPLAPAAAAEAVTDPAARRRLREMMVLLESTRHPLTDDQVALVQQYADALGETGPGLVLEREVVRDGAAHALADYQRFSEAIFADIAEPSLVAGGGLEKDHPDPELSARLKGMRDLPEGSLGRAYVAFYERNNLTFPGDDPNSPAIFVAHDMTHVIAGYEPTGPGELALGAFQIAMNDSDAHWIAFLGSLAIHEAGWYNAPGFVGKTATLARPGALDTFTEAFERGQQCTGDFSAVDHLSMVERPLADVRADFNVVPVVHDR